MCRVIVEQGGYRTAWVGYAQDDERKSIRVMAQASAVQTRVEKYALTWADAERGHTAAAVAIRTGKPSGGRNMLTDPYYAPWHDEIMRDGYASASAFPLRIDGQVIGNLSINASEPDAFDEAEVGLLGELADDLAYGISNLRMRIRQQEAEKTIE